VVKPCLLQALQMCQAVAQPAGLLWVQVLPAEGAVLATQVVRHARVCCTAEMSWHIEKQEVSLLSGWYKSVHACVNCWLAQDSICAPAKKLSLLHECTSKQAQFTEATGGHSCCDAPTAYQCMLCASQPTLPVAQISAKQLQAHLKSRMCSSYTLTSVQCPKPGTGCSHHPGGISAGLWRSTNMLRSPLAVVHLL
jgi:hypothetical protein